jgi:hypothetical protein
MVLVFTGGGFEPGDLAKFILKSHPIRPKPAAKPESIREVAATPGRRHNGAAPSAQALPELPATAARISRQNYQDVRESRLDLAN